eukprot:1183201-Prorocentrum_minimum.AAC.9
MRPIRSLPTPALPHVRYTTTQRGLCGELFFLLSPSPSPGPLHLRPRRKQVGPRRGMGGVRQRFALQHRLDVLRGERLLIQQRVRHNSEGSNSERQTASNCKRPKCGGACTNRVVTRE